MGRWGLEPWANDSAADWFDAMFQLTGLATHVEQTLNLRLDEYSDEVRAAAHIVLMLAEYYTWPIESRQRCVELAITRLQEIVEEMADPNLETAIQAEIDALQLRSKRVE